MGFKRKPQTPLTKRGKTGWEINSRTRVGTLKELPTFGVGRIHSMFMYPMTFDEFLEANNQKLLLEARNKSSIEKPLPDVLHKKLVEQLRTYMLVEGMPEAVKIWVENHDYIKCQEVQDDIIVAYEDDFPKYKKTYTQFCYVRH